MDAFPAPWFGGPPVDGASACDRCATVRAHVSPNSNSMRLWKVRWEGVQRSGFLCFGRVRKLQQEQALSEPERGEADPSPRPSLPLLHSAALRYRVLLKSSSLLSHRQSPVD